MANDKYQILFWMLGLQVSSADKHVGVKEQITKPEMVKLSDVDGWKNRDVNEKNTRTFSHAGQPTFTIAVRAVEIV